jgi:hypothetical protein
MWKFFLGEKEVDATGNSSAVFGHSERIDTAKCKTWAYVHDDYALDRTRGLSWEFELSPRSGQFAALSWI